MCKIREHIVERIENHKIEELYKEIVTSTMHDFVLDTIDELIRKKKIEMNNHVFEDELISINERYFAKCRYNDLTVEVKRLKLVRNLFENATYGFEAC